MLVHEPLLLHAAELVNFREDVAGGDVGLVFCENSAPVGLTIGRGVLVYSVLNVFLIMS